MHPRLQELFEYLDAQRADLADAVRHIPLERQTAVPSSGGWSVAQVMEHLVLLEARVTKAFRIWLVEAKSKGLPTETETSPILPTIATARVIARDSKRVSPPQGEPTGTISVEEAGRKLDEIRAEMKATLAEGDGYALETIVQPHPAVGPINLYQWIGVTAAHMRRHANQIRDIDASLRADNR